MIRSGIVDGGSVDTTNSAVVGEGRRTRKYGAVVNIVAIAIASYNWLRVAYGMYIAIVHV